MKNRNIEAKKNKKNMENIKMLLYDNLPMVEIWEKLGFLFRKQCKLCKLLRYFEGK